ncbi:MAG: methyltransferase type 11 [candidate division Zixibacteria bacterium HGW-Zixibacteria-1]|nr:MAG: methyltransferase type 11 [candidate division Zixibacteria bacterium HGW-Zixibacteria-1]
MSRKKPDRMSDISFTLMSFVFKVMDLFHSPVKKIDSFGISEGMTIVDYGCGPGRYIERASKLVGPNGKVYAADVQELAAEAIKKKMTQLGLTNVEPVVITGYSCPIESHTADMIYALDMFHMVKNPTELLKELHRIVKQDGFLIIDDGHQPRETTKSKILASGVWKITEEHKKHLKCLPV